MIYLAIIITTSYVALIAAFIIGFERVQSFGLSKTQPTTQFSILIPFRNEATNLPGLLQSIAALDYPKELFEVILINDASEDDSTAIIESSLSSIGSDNYQGKTPHNIRIIDNRRKSVSPKKDAIETALEHACYDWIITTDADCHVPEKWLVVFNAYIQENDPYFIAAPVTYPLEKSFMKRFQLLDLLSLQGATIGAFGINQPFLCNGANLCYRKDIFKAVQGFEGNSEIASGDDIFLMEKVLKKYPDKVSYLKATKAMVTTKAQASLNDLIDQRKRWAAKSTHYQNIFGKLVAITVLAMNTFLVVLLITSFLGYTSWILPFFVLLVKMFMDLMLLVKTAAFFQQQKVLATVVTSSFIYPIFSMFVAIASLQSSYQWKGRTFKK